MANCSKADVKVVLQPLFACNHTPISPRIREVKWTTKDAKYWKRITHGKFTSLKKKKETYLHVERMHIHANKK